MVLSPTPPNTGPWIVECAMGVTPGVADSLFGPDLRLVLGLIVVLVGASRVKLVCSTKCIPKRSSQFCP